MSGQMTLLPGKVPTRLGVGGLLMVMVLLLCGALWFLSNRPLPKN